MDVYDRARCARVIVTRVDYGAGLAAAFAIASALFQRTRTGAGQYIDLPMLDSAMMLMASTITSSRNTGKTPGPSGNMAPSRSPASNTFATREGQLAIAINEQHQFRHLMVELGLEAMLDDPRFADAPARRENRDALAQALDQALLTRTASDWETRLNEASVPAARVRNIPEALAEQQMVERGLFHRFARDEAGLGRELEVPLTAFHYATDGPSVQTPPPKVGQHTDEVLKSLGYAAGEIEAMRAAGAV